jgi:hypothetical protein
MYLVLAYGVFKVFYRRFSNTFMRHVLNVIAAVYISEIVPFLILRLVKQAY